MKNKERIQILENRLNIQSRLLDNIITKLELDNEQEELKQLDQSAFDHPYVDDRFKYVALNADSQAVFFESKPVIDNYLDIWVEHTGSIMPMLKGYDASNWQTSLIERESIPQLKELDHSVFNGLNSKWLYAAIDSDGELWIYTHKPDIDSNYWYVDEPEGREIGEGYDTTNWQTSLIERETIELTGSDLARAMLARGDKYVMCKTSGTGEAEAMESKYLDVIQKCDWEFFYTPYKKRYAVPVNNQGEPLTSSDVGL